jgi:hypothetical protein
VIVSGALVALLPPDPRRPRPWPGAADTIRQEQAVALLTSRLERGGGMPVPIAWDPPSAWRHDLQLLVDVCGVLIESASGREPLMLRLPS